MRAAADWVVPGHKGDGVAATIIEPVLRGLPLHRSPRHRTRLGWHAVTGEEVSIPARGINVPIHGDSASGKSWLAGVIIEQLVAQQYSVCILDPEGDYKTLGRSPQYGMGRDRQPCGRPSGAGSAGARAAALHGRRRGRALGIDDTDQMRVKPLLGPPRAILDEKIRVAD